MAHDKKAILDALDGMALKIVLVEPGDLSVIGELLEHLDTMLVADAMVELKRLRSMAAVIYDVLDKIIMTELDDSSNNYDAIGDCVTLMQDVARGENDADEQQVRGFIKLVAGIGYTCDEQSVLDGAVETKHAVIESGEIPLDDNTSENSSSELAEDLNESDTPEETVQPETVSPSAGSVEADAQEGEMIVQQPDEFMQDLELLGGFIEESIEHLETIEVNVLELEHTPDDPEIINNIFRPFHTIKGVSGFLNLKAINKLAHTTENLLDDVRNGVHPMDSQVIDIVLSVGDYLRKMIDNLREVMEKGAEAYENYDIRGYIAQIQAIQSGAVPADVPASSENVSTASPIPESSATAGSQVNEASSLSQKAAIPSPPPPKKAAGQQVAAKKIDASIKVNVEKLDALVNAVGELVIMQSLVQENPNIRSIVDPKLNRDFSQLGRITSELQKTAMSMRMVPIRQTFQKMIRLVRDLSKKSGKIVDLVMEGEETEIDRNMVDSIYDPLVHMIRNSVDHGVQTPEEREKRGMPRAGTVNLRAYQKGGYMVIEIEDDGNGLNTDKIRQKGIERGLVQADDNLSDHELNNLIFVPGFSTADKITDVSGRGVGMDVVKKAVEKLRGKVEVFSQMGKGSTFIIKLPLTLAIIDGIIVRVGSERYIIPTIAIKESLKPEETQYQTVYNRGEAILLRDNLVPIVRLYQMFDVETACMDPCKTILVVVEHEGQQRALMVDELLGKQEVVIKSLGGLLKDIRGVAGGTILGDGRVGLILDLAGLFSTGSGSIGDFEDEDEDF